MGSLGFIVAFGKVKGKCGDYNVNGDDAEFGRVL